MIGLLLFALTGFSKASVQSPKVSTPDRPNVVLILSDYMGYGDIGPYGVPDIRTPHLDRMAREGVKLTQFYAAAPFCTPARIALLTGRYQHRAGREMNALRNDVSTALPTSEATLASLLKGAGYATGMFGKWHLGYEPRFGPNAHGFDEFFGFHDWTIDYFSHRTYTGEPGLYENTTPVEREGYITELLTDRAVSFIDKQAANPFFLYVSYNAALPPAQPPGRPWDIRDKETWDSSTRQDYAKVVEALDAGIGRILDQLDHSQLAEKTLVIFSYDHGGRELSRTYPFFHGFATLWEGGLRVPCLLRWPAELPAGSVSDQLAIQMDLTASILGATGVEPPAGRTLDGIDLFPIFKGKKLPVEREFFWRLNLRIRQQKAARRGRWKYVRDGADMLFDVVADPGERKNLVYTNPAVMKDLKERLAAWELEVGGPSQER